MDGILFDLDGVFYVGNQLIPGSLETLAWVQDQAIPHLFLTNTTSRPRSALVSKLSRLGIQIQEDQLLTPALAAIKWIKQHTAGKTALFVPEVTRSEFHELPCLDETESGPVDAVVIGDLGEAWNFETLNRAFRLLMQQPPAALIALGMTRYWRAPDGLRLDTAPFVVALQHASGVTPTVLGKPAKGFFAAALDRIGCTAPDTIMVGDDIRGDIGGAQEAGIRGVLVRTGKFQPSDLASGIQPAAVLASIAELPAWWKAQSR
ncbi:MAG: TIGR01458 family HAD-type hydrolase [Chromatiales bacterium]